MSTVLLHWIETPVNDPFTKDTYAIADSGFNTTSNSYVHDEVAYELPEGYEVGKTVGEEVAIFDNKGDYCVLDRYSKRPRLISKAGVVLLKLAR